ncbi:hypothetical protein SteCoe_34466 [Stentor coeruleus]|uniref:Uncharacterized protein n=1 Tax=Stentor coeruleus TaxID=5963 RepID=A0A1R2AUF4_9CILI|nr:hypothetical protein SteCoe_34466 [Stentor coeruleus]
MKNVSVKSPNKSVEKFIWESSIPESLKKLNSKITDVPSSTNYFNFKRSRGNHPFLNKKKLSNPSSQVSLSQATSGPNFYSIKYLGITNGQIGILSKRAPIPQLSAMETCKDVPLAIINTSANDSKSSRNFGKLIASSVKKLENRPFSKEAFGNYIEDSFPNPNEYNEFVIHTYARPRGLNAIRRSQKKEFSADAVKPASAAMQRNGICGWKLTRPKTTVPKKERIDKGLDNRCTESFQIECKHLDINDGYGEPYLKHLAKFRRSKTREAYSRLGVIKD